MDTEVEKALVYGLNLAIYNRLSDLTNEEFEEYITSICSLLECQLSSFEETIQEEHDRESESEPAIYEPVKRSTKNTRRISSGMIPYREG